MEAREIERRFIPRVGNFVCNNTHIRIVNQVIYKEYIFAKWEKRKDWAKRAAERLRRDYNIHRSPCSLEWLLSRIRCGKRTAVAASDFADGVSYDSVPSSRYEKDAMHGKMDVLIHEYLSPVSHQNTHRALNYIGLPANQIVAVSNKYDFVVACERDADMARFMADMNRYIGKDPNTLVYNGDIFEYLEETETKFNIYEFDLMCAINLPTIVKMANIIDRTAEDRALIAVISLGGRTISKGEYELLMPGELICSLESVGFDIINNPYSGNYRDVKTPMRYELLVIER